MFVEMLPAIVRTSEGLRGAPGVCGVSPPRPRGGPWPAPPQGRPQRVAGRAEAAGRGGARGPAGRAAGLRGPRGAGGAVPQRPPRPGRSAAPPRAPRQSHGAAARPGPHTRTAAGGLPGGGSGGHRGRGVPTRAPGPARAPPPTIATFLACLLCQPVPNFPQAPSASPRLSGFRSPGVGRVSARWCLWVRVPPGHQARARVWGS